MCIRDSLYAGAHGYIDNYPESALKKYEQEVLSYVENKHPDLLAEIKEKEQLDSTIEDKLTSALNNFKEQFVY